MKTQLLGYLEAFTDYYQATILRRLVAGVIIGGLVWICIFIIALVMGVFIEDNLWLKTVQIDLPGIGGIFALLVSFQIWGLLPQPFINGEEQLSTDTEIAKDEVTEDSTHTESVETVDKKE